MLGNIVRKTVGKIVEKIGKKKPFGGKGGRRKKEPEQIQQPAEEQQDLDQSCFDAETYENGTESTGGLFNDFFYVNDGFIARFEDDDILKHIQKKFP